jgi:hypothetical protein
MKKRTRGKTVHKLLWVDVEQRIGTCRNCGTVKLKKKGKNGWRCWEAEREERLRTGTYSGASRRHKSGAHKTDSCERCGFTAKHRSQLDVHHRDHNNLNNDLSNLETICANCHRLEHASTYQRQKARLPRRAEQLGLIA